MNEVHEYPEDIQRLRAALGRLGYQIDQEHAINTAMADAYVRFCQVKGALWLGLPDTDEAVEGMVAAILRENLLPVVPLEGN